ncbi:hypothetical protein NQ318_021338 [Aromia moschata]|uniref:Uncharacterized protein n=1 Tax=Aromia moschata TaxID=1265417 RepID=A0AAV8ZC04_9CUCU|nr:hypothetical protein NQ318_021338 [Aromia moschata]
MRNGKGAEMDKFVVRNVSVEAEESWNDCNATTYDPKAKLDVESALQKKKFQVQKRHRLSQFQVSSSSKSETVAKAPSSEGQS